MKTSTTVPHLPPELLEKLRCKNPAKGKYTRRSPIDACAVAEAGVLFGIAEDSEAILKGGQRLLWNATINALDAYHPGWRGYPTPKTFMNFDRIAA